MSTSPKLEDAEALALSILRDGDRIIVPDIIDEASTETYADGSPIIHTDTETKLTTLITFKRRTIDNLVDRGLLDASPTAGGEYVAEANLAARTGKGIFARLTDSGRKRAATLPETKIEKSVSTKRYRNR